MKLMFSAIKVKQDTKISLNVAGFVSNVTEHFTWIWHYGWEGGGLQSAGNLVLKGERYSLTNRQSCCSKLSQKGQLS